MKLVPMREIENIRLRLFQLLELLITALRQECAAIGIFAAQYLIYALQAPSAETKSN